MADAQHTSLIITGLKNAHAMENQALSIMKPQVSRIENYPEVARRLEQHIAETESQIARLEDLLDSFDTDHSTLKDMALSVAGSVAAMGHTIAADEILKNSFANFAFEHFEIAAYKSMLVLSELGGYREVTAVLQTNLKEEQAMAQWLDENLRDVTLRFASLKESGQTAKV
ncbi:MULTISPECIES: ferritin-like domain-containing protein [unclassified Rhizobium]|uniref:ferritin-like domain-containing protein n=1 Tax=unclassified Rhizobium TaxID=2613769 RepID=UPI0007EA443E|nr:MULTISPECIES: ferritin-like domain-containing protein [unclassified Rhizobium]ANM13237.1 ferritin-related protein YciE [Rhizobium sp. N324]ANM19635.1 ferritin-related protein YciE [Rhizobium sp. N541]ANM26020.1 ferritin-related protein YciE [Rhizobium sp. N941]OYD01029.1 ferritin-related protein YciE [Rhizobium sp. N4311]